MNFQLVFYFVKRSVKFQNFRRTIVRSYAVPLYDHTPVLQKELKCARLTIILSTVEDGGGHELPKMHEFAKSQIAAKINERLPQIIWS